MAFYDAFFGSDQSLYTAYAIMAAIIAICITILLTATDISVGNRILIVLFVIITLVPSIFLTLFEITCMVTGGTEPNRWWCYAFAWILAAFIIIYCVFVVIISLISLFTYNNAIDNVNEAEKKNKLSDTDTNHIAKQIIFSDEEKKKMENFYLMPDANERFEGNGGGDVSTFQNKENFGAEPMNELLPAPVPIPPPPKMMNAENFNNGEKHYPSPSPSLLSNFDNLEGFESYNADKKNYFSDFSPSGVANTLHDIKNSISLPSFGNLM
jgi:hypothetical protein